jgi:membrane-associated protease RseP (regulator of RpoE activity)
MFMTALNLLPGGQLDGGHIIYALWPKGHRIVTALTLGILIPLGIFFFNGWLVWAVILAGFSRHPRVSDESGLARRRVGLAFFALAMFVISIHWNPIVLANEKTIWQHLVDLSRRLL